MSEFPIDDQNESDLVRAATLLEQVAASLTAQLAVPGEDPRIDARPGRVSITDAAHVDTELELAEALLQSLWTACRDHAMRISRLRGRLADHRSIGTDPHPA